MDLVMKIVIVLPVILFSVIVHEIAHGYVAYLFGDDTAKRAGRLTLNPIPHIDPWMSIGLPLLLIVLKTGFIFGGAKPVPINPVFIRDPNRDMKMMLVTLAGAASNILLLIISLILIKLVAVFPVLYSEGLRLVLVYMAIINTVLAVFNLIPIPPLDGSKVLAHFLPLDLREKFLSVERFGFIIILIMIVTGILGLILMPPIVGVIKLIEILGM